MSKQRPAYPFAEMLAHNTANRYQTEVASLESLPTTQAQAEARRLIRLFAQNGFHREYGRAGTAERFDQLWQLAFPAVPQDAPRKASKGPVPRGRKGSLSR